MENENDQSQIDSNEELGVDRSSASETNSIVEATNDEQKMESPLVDVIPYRKAGFWIRFWAYIIDVIIVSSLNSIILSPLVFFQDTAILQWEYISVMGILSGIVYYLYFLFMTKIFSQTLGKMIIGIQVISTQEKQVTWGDLLFREVIGRFLHNVFFILKLLYITVAFTDKKQGIHDMIGSTRVVHINP